MSTGKHTSLEEACNDDKLDRFIKEHPSKADKEQFDSLLDAMRKGEPPKKPAAGRGT